jgi:hypothetical protein
MSEVKCFVNDLNKSPSFDYTQDGLFDDMIFISAFLLNFIAHQLVSFFSYHVEHAFEFAYSS